MQTEEEAITEINHKIGILECYKKEIIKLTRNLQAEKQIIEGLWEELHKQRIETGEAKRQVEEKKEQLERILRNHIPRVGGGGVHEKKHFVGPIQLLIAMILTFIITSVGWQLFMIAHPKRQTF